MVMGDQWLPYWEAQKKNIFITIVHNSAGLDTIGLKEGTPEL